MSASVCAAFVLLVIVWDFAVSGNAGVVGGVVDVVVVVLMLWWLIVVVVVVGRHRAPVTGSIVCAHQPKR